MKKTAALVLILGLLFSAVFAETVFEKADKLYDDSMHKEGFALMEGSLKDFTADKDLAEVYWRLSQFQLAIGDEMKNSGTSSKDALLDWFTKGEEYANKAVELDPRNPLGYYWRASNSGRWGQTKGILDSLARAKPMRDDLSRALEANDSHADSYHVLGVLYASVPGVISFGNTNYAVSFGRKAVDLMDPADKSLSHFLELAKSLSQRGNSAKKNEKWLKEAKQNFGKQGSVMENHFYYEGVKDMSSALVYAPRGVANLGDKEEAKLILEFLIKEYKALPSLSINDKGNLAEAEELLKSL